jgi:secondary thiamine-phosphate synthase enzyme
MHGMKVFSTSFSLTSDERTEVSDITKLIRESIQQFPISNGIALINTLHTTCALFINEFQTALLSDIRRFLEQMVARDAAWMHNDPEHSDCDRMNADSHLRALLLGHSLTLQVSGGEVVLGQWQRILMAELDGPRARSLRIQIFGVS